MNPQLEVYLSEIHGEENIGPGLSPMRCYANGGLNPQRRKHHWHCTQPTTGRNSTLVFMVQSLALKFKVAAHIVPVHSADGKLLHEVPKEVIFWFGEDWLQSVMRCNRQQQNQQESSIDLLHLARLQRLALFMSILVILQGHSLSFVIVIF